MAKKAVFIILLAFLILIVIFAINIAIFLGFPSFISRKIKDPYAYTVERNEGVLGTVPPVLTPKQNSIAGLGTGLFVLEIAQSEADRLKGLSGRLTLPLDHGLLFVFEKPGLQGFWMKDMNFSLDIIWLDSNLRVVHVEKDLKPETFPKVFYPMMPALYVLEVNAGLAEQYGIILGSQMKLL